VVKTKTDLGTFDFKTRQLGRNLFRPTPDTDVIKVAGDELAIQVLQGAVEDQAKEKWPQRVTLLDSFF
jgi:hypothetical protein